MASLSSTGAQAKLNLTADEKRLFAQLFGACDDEGLGVVTGEAAVKFFEKSGLTSGILGDVSVNPRGSSRLQR